MFEVNIDDDTFIESTYGRQFRVVFNVLLDFGGHISYCDLAIYNLADSTASRILKKGSGITLRAGYDHNVDLVFKGAIRNVFKGRDGPDTFSRIIARGGSQPETTSVSRTLGAPAKLTNIIKECADAMGYPLVIKNDDFSGVLDYARGYTLHGDPRVYLDSLAKTHNFSYVIDNERLIVVGNSSYRDGVPLIVSESTGLEGYPEVTEIGTDVAIRLNPKVRIGGRIDVQSELRDFNFSNLYFQDIPERSGSGVYRVFKIEHSGDSYGSGAGSWTTKITGYR